MFYKIREYDAENGMSLDIYCSTSLEALRKHRTPFQDRERS